MTPLENGLPPTPLVERLAEALRNHDWRAGDANEYGLTCRHSDHQFHAFCGVCAGDTESMARVLLPVVEQAVAEGVPQVILTDAERRELAYTFHGVEWLSPERAACVERIIAARLNPNDVSLLDPWGPFEMRGFEGCTDADPTRCACATDSQPTCEVCGQEIEPGEQAWARQWPCYNTLPIAHPDQDWDVISWHDECPDTRPIPAGTSEEQA